MSNLKEIRARINSVASTEKITNAMKMVSAAKLKKSENTTLRFLPYKNKLNETLTNYLCSFEETVRIPLAEQREPKRVALLAFSSSSGLCGVYNANVSKLFLSTYNEYVEKLGAENVEVHLFGKKITEFAQKNGITVTATYKSVSDELSYALATELSNRMVQAFIEHRIDRVVAVYNHHKNAGVQQPMTETLLPIGHPYGMQTVMGYSTDRASLREAPDASRRDALSVATGSQNPAASRRDALDYLVEPSKEEFINELIPKVIRTAFYSVMLDAMTAEHGARMTAMLIASDNAAALLQELRRDYNRARQNVITTELIDIVGGAEALNK